MMRSLPRFNSIIQHEMGDGFRGHVLPNLIGRMDLVVTHPSLIRCNYRDFDGAITTGHRLHKIDPSTYDRVIIDMRLPREGTKMLDQFRRICKSKVVIFTEPFRDPATVNSAVCIIAIAKPTKFKTVVFNRFQHMGYG